MATAQVMQPLLDAEEKIPAILSEYRPELLARSEDDQPCLLTGFLNGLVSGEYRRDLPAISRNLSANLPASDLHCDKVTGTITTHVPAQQFHKVITVTLWPETVSGHLIGEILALQGDIEICQICDPWGSDQAMLVNKRRMAGESNSWFGNPAAAAEVSTLLDLLAEGKTALFATQFQIIPRAETEDKLNTLIREITEILGNKRIGYALQTRGAPVCWFNRLPVVSKRKIRLPGSQFMAPLDLRDQNIAALWALPHSATGMLASQFGPAPVRWFKTPTGQSYVAEQGLMSVLRIAFEIWASISLGNLMAGVYGVLLALPYIILIIVYFSQVVVSIFRVMMFSALSPILMLAVGFGWGRGMAITGVRTVFAAFMVLFGSTLALALCLYGAASLDIQNTENVREITSIDNPGLWVAIVLGWMGTAFMAEATGMANSIAGSQLA